MEKKLGVYICACGGNISDYVDIEKVKEAISGENAVILAKTTMFACGDSNQKDMVADIIENDLSGIVVASCSPKLHLTTFRNVSERAGLNKYNYVHANIREQASWAHSNDKKGATQKAIQLVKAAIAKARHANSLDSIVIESQRSVAVIGAGVAGMRAAIALAQMNDKVYLIERDENTGGKLNKIERVSPLKLSGKELVNRLNEDIEKNGNITLLKNTKVVKSSGNIGDFKLTLLNKNGVESLINVGSVLVATGFDSYQPLQGEYGYGEIPQVITLPDFKELISASGNGKLIFGNREVKNIAYIYCVGSRQLKGDNKYCSRFCCTAAIQSSLDVREKYPQINTIHFHKGIRTYGKQELIYKESNSNGDLYVQFPDKEVPAVSFENGLVTVKSKDILSSKREVEVNVDLVVLVTGMVPDKDESIGTIFKLPRGRDKFFNEIHLKLRPVETVIDGVTIAGTCQAPKNVMESVDSALAAAVKSHSFVSKGELSLEPIIAEVDADSCNWCNECTKACPFNAIAPVESGGKRIASINQSTCKGCGMCLPVCPSDSIELRTFSNKEVEDMISVLAGQN